MFTRFLLTQRVLGKQFYQLVQKQSCSSSTSTFKFCIVGSGPAGFYSASRILGTFKDEASVDILDRLPSPYGLVRSGVAPDHEETKAVIKNFKRIAESPQVKYFGGVHVGKNVTVSELRKLYHVVVLAYGAEDDWKLNIPGEDASNVFSARQFVWWYNTHPDHKLLQVNLENAQSAVIVGNGNVAIDCARVLLKKPSELESTEIAQYALQQLRKSQIKQVHIVARRGPAQAAFTAKEFRELTGLHDLKVYVHPPDLAISDADQKEIKGDRLKRRIVDLVMAIATQQAKAGAKVKGKGHSGGGDGDKKEGVIAWKQRQREMKDKKRKKRSFEDSVEVASDEDVKKSASKSGFSVVWTTLAGDKDSIDSQFQNRTEKDQSVQAHYQQQSPDTKQQERFISTSELCKRSSDMLQSLMERELHFHFYAQPTRIMKEHDGMPLGILLEQTRLEKDPNSDAQHDADGDESSQSSSRRRGQKAVGTGEFYDIDTGLVLSSIGYRGVPQEDVPYDEKRGIIPNIKGQVVQQKATNGNQEYQKDQEAEPVPGLYVTGWLKRGATGIIGTNIVDAHETVESIADEMEGMYKKGEVEQKDGREGLESLLSKRHVQYINYAQWRAVEKAEVQEGQKKQKSREKFLSVRKMVEVGLDSTEE